MTPAASATSHLVQSPPSYALSQHARQAGLSDSGNSDFGLSHSPGAIPSASSGDNVGGTNNALFKGRSGALKHSDTIVGRYGERSGPSSGIGPGTRLRGKRSSWKPKPHHLDSTRSSQTLRENGNGYSTARPSLSSIVPSNLIIASSEGSNLPNANLNPSNLVTGINSDDSGSEAYDGRNIQRRRAASSFHPPLLMVETGLSSDKKVNRVPLPLSASPRETYAPLSPLTAFQSDESVRKERERHFEALDNAGFDVERGGGEETENEDQGNGEEAEAEAEDDQEEEEQRQETEIEDSEVDQASDTSEDNLTRLAEIEEFGGEDEEEDDFEFSLHRRDETSSLERASGGFGASRHDTESATTLVSLPNLAERKAILPSIAEAAELGDVGVPGKTGGEEEYGERKEHEAGKIGQQTEGDAALHAAQTARRRARRRVNISGRIPFNLGLPLSPESTAMDGLANTSQVIKRGVESNDRARSATLSELESGNNGNLSPVLDRNPAESRSMSPIGGLSDARSSNRPDKLRTRQRAKTEPVPKHDILLLPSPLSNSTPKDGEEISSSVVRKRFASNPSKFLGSLPSSAPDLSITLSAPPSTSTALTASVDDMMVESQTGSVDTAMVRSNSAGGDLESATQSNRKLSPHPSLPGLSMPAAPSSSSSSTADNRIPSPVTPNMTSTSLLFGSSPSKSPSKSYDPYISFPISRSPVVPFQPPKQSALSIMLRSDDLGGPTASSNNPFNEFYGALFAPIIAVSVPANRLARRGPGTGGGPSTNTYEVTVYYPQSNDSSKSLKMNLKLDLVVEEVIGCALWKYWAEERRPSLCANEEEGNDNEWEKRDSAARALLNVSAWVLRIADEDEDGEVDDDFPAPDRTRTAKGFGNCFAIVAASATQIRQNLATDSQIQRRPSRIIKKIQIQRSTSVLSPSHISNSAASLAPPTTAHILPYGGGGGASLYSASLAGTPSKASFNMAGSAAPLVYLRIRIPLSGVEDITTTLHVPSDMYLADVLELTCKKKSLENPKEWILVVPDRGIVVPLDRTVESLQGTHQLALQRRGIMPNNAAATSSAREKRAGLQNTNPNASIFKRLSEPPQPKYVTSADLNTNYRSYAVLRKMPMPLGRHERVLSIDNDYVHIMPSDTKLMSGTVRTASYHISQVALCKTSKRAPSSFKLVVWRDKDKDVKRYDFEASNSRMAGEIAQTIQALMQGYKESLGNENNM